MNNKRHLLMCTDCMRTNDSADFYAILYLCSDVFGQFNIKPKISSFDL